MQKLNLTQIRQLPKPVKEYTEDSASSVVGLRIRIYSTGIRSWVFKYKRGNKQNALTLGRVEGMSVKEAEAEAKRLRSLLSLGHDPAEELRQARTVAEAAKALALRENELNPPFKDFAHDYLERHAKRLKQSWKNDASELRLYILPAIGHLRLKDVKRIDIIRLLDTMRDNGITTKSNRVRSLLHKMFNWAIQRALLENNPVTLTERLKEKSRERVLSDAEVRRLWQASGDSMAGLALRFLLVSMKRIGEVAALKWSDIHDGAIHLRSTKNGHADVIPLSTGILAVLADVKRLSTRESEYIFQGRTDGINSGSVRQFMRRLGWHGSIEEHPRPHDLRRTAATLVSKLGNRREVLRQLLNHVDNSVDAVYDRWSYLPEKKKALDELWGELQRITGTNVVNIDTSQPAKHHKIFGASIT